MDIQKGPTESRYVNQEWIYSRNQLDPNKIYPLIRCDVKRLKDLDFLPKELKIFMLDNKIKYRIFDLREVTYGNNAWIYSINDNIDQDKIEELIKAINNYGGESNFKHKEVLETKYYMYSRV